MKAAIWIIVATGTAVLAVGAAVRPAAVSPPANVSCSTDGVAVFSRIAFEEDGYTIRGFVALSGPVIERTDGTERSVRVLSYFLEASNGRSDFAFKGVPSVTLTSSEQFQSTGAFLIHGTERDRCRIGISPGIGQTWADVASDGDLRVSLIP